MIGTFPEKMTKFRYKPAIFFEVKPYCFEKELILVFRFWVKMLDFGKKGHGYQNSILGVQRTFLREFVVSHQWNGIHKNLPTPSEKPGFLVTTVTHVWKNYSACDETNFMEVFFSGQKAKFVISFWFWAKDYQTFSRFFWQGCQTCNRRIPKLINM